MIRFANIAKLNTTTNSAKGCTEAVTDVNSVNSFLNLV